MYTKCIFYKDFGPIVKIERRKEAFKHFQDMTQKSSCCDFTILLKTKALCLKKSSTFLTCVNLIWQDILRSSQSSIQSQYFFVLQAFLLEKNFSQLSLACQKKVEYILQYNYYNTGSCIFQDNQISYLINFLSMSRIKHLVGIREQMSGPEIS